MSAILKKRSETNAEYLVSDNTGSLEDLVKSNFFKDLKEARLVPDLDCDLDQDYLYRQEAIRPTVFPDAWPTRNYLLCLDAIQRIQALGARHNFTLIDCHPYNFVPINATALNVDLDSFAETFSTWRDFPHLQFFKCFSLPIALSLTNSPALLRTIFALNGCGLPLGIKSRSKKRVTYIAKCLRFAIEYKLETLILAVCVLFQRSTLSEYLISILYKLLIASLKKRLRSSSLEQAWSNYHQESQCMLNKREESILQQCSRLGVSSSIELGANTGYLSRELLRRRIVKHAVIQDLDDVALGKGIDLSTSIPHGNAAFACFDLIQETDCLTSRSLKQNPPDLVIAMALTHHLCITQGYSLATIIKIISSYSVKYIIIEFMPYGLWSSEDPHVKNPSKYDHHEYNQANFEYQLRSVGNILSYSETEVNRITYLVEKTNSAISC
jgi:hypothetical protein